MEYWFSIDSDVVSYVSPKLCFVRQHFHLIPQSLFFSFFFLSFVFFSTDWISFSFLFFFFFTRSHRHRYEEQDGHKHWKTLGTLIKKTKITEWYDLVSEPSSDTTWCEPRDHVVTQPTTKNEIGSRKSRNRSDRSVTQWKLVPRHQNYWNE